MYFKLRNLIEIHVQRNCKEKLGILEKREANTTRTSCAVGYKKNHTSEGKKNNTLRTEI